MNLQLQGRVALVTGGSRGIGASIVREMVKEGSYVILCARQSDALTNLEAEIRASGGNCSAVPVDVFDKAAVIAAVDSAARVAEGIDILVNNVGGAIKFGSFEDLSDDDWIRAYEFNVLSLVRFTRACLPYLRRSSLRRIINISSISALQPGHYNPHYTATKAAVVNIGKYLANILAKEAILVNTICSGPVNSESWNESIKQTALTRGILESDARSMVEQAEAAKIPLGRIGAAENIAPVVAFLASPISNWTTGSCFHINGGKLTVAL